MIFGGEVCFVAGEVGCAVYRFIRLVECSINSCENLLEYACKKGVPVIRGVINQVFHFGLTKNIQFEGPGLVIVVV